MANIADDPLFKDLAPQPTRNVEPPPNQTAEPTTVPNSLANDPLFQDFAVQPEADVPEQSIGVFDDPLFKQAREQGEVGYAGLLAQGDNPELDRVGLSDMEPGFAAALWGGTAGIISSVRTLQLKIGEGVTGWLEENYPGPVAEYFRGQTELERQYLAQSDMTAASTPISDTFTKLAETGIVNEETGFFSRETAEGAGKFFDAFMESDEKWTAVKELVGLSAVPSLAEMAGYYAGGLPGVGITAVTMMWGDDYRKSLAEGKSDEEAMTAATIKALTQAGGDMAAFGVARIKLANNVFKDAAAQTAWQAFTGGGTEIFKHELVDESYTIGEALLEATGEVVTALPELAFVRNVGKKNATIKELETELLNLIQQDDMKAAKIALPELIQKIQDSLNTAAEEDVDGVLDLEAQGLTGNMSGIKGPLGGSQLGVGAGTSGITTYPQIRNPDVIAKFWEQLKVVNPETGAVEPALEHDFTTAPVAIAQETLINENIKHNEAIVTLSDDIIQGLEFDEQGNPRQLQTLEEMGQVGDAYKAKEEAETRLAELIPRREREFKYANYAAQLLTEWLQALMPGTNIIYSTDQAGYITSLLEKDKDFDVKAKSTVAGHNYNLADGTAIIELDLDTYTNPDGSIRENVWIEDLIHEFGHALFSQVYNAQSASTRKALYKGWAKWLKKLLSSKTTKEYMSHRFGAEKSKRFYKGDNVEFNPAEDVDRKRYEWGMNEWVANELAKSLQTNAVVQEPAKKFFKELIDKLKEFFHLTEGKYSSADTYQQFINLLAAKTELGRLRRAEGGDNLTRQEAGRRALKMVNNISKELGFDVPSGALPSDVSFPHEMHNMRGDIDRFGFFTRTSAGIFQLQERNPHITGLRKFTDNIIKWWNDKMKFIARADDRLHAWRDLGDKRAAAVGAFLQDLTVLSYGNNKQYRPGMKEFDKLVQKHKLDQEQLDMIAEIEGDMTAVLDELYNVLLADVNKMTDVFDRQAKLDQLNKDFDALRNRNFYPLSRFGEYYLRVKAKTDMVFEGKEYKEGDVITFEMFEGGTLFTNFSMDTPPALKKREARFRNNALFEVASGVVNDTQKEFAGLPPQLLQMMRDKLDLTDAQKKELDNLLRDIAPGRSFTKHMKTRKNVNGYSSDALRAYADYFMHFGNYVARIKYKGVLMDNIAEVKDSANIIAQTGDNAVKRGRIAQRMEADFDYAMNPDNEWANLRAIGFLWYLGFVPKSAYINLTQVPFVTYSHLAARFGDGAAMKQLLKSTKDTFGAYKNRKLRPDQNRLIDYLIETGVIEESMATEIAAVAEGRALSRTATNTLFGSQKAGSTIRQFAGYGSWMFQQAERFNRRITALAAYDLAINKGIPIRNQVGKLTGKFRKVNEAEAFRFAHQAVVSSQFEYARFNRPPFMRGKKSNLFLFYNYLQNMLYFVGNDPGASRYILLMLLAAGLSGLPFAEDAMDIFDFTAKKINKATKNEQFLPINIRKELQTQIAQIGANPDLIMHGASRYGFGMPALAEMVGLPMSNWDVGGSVSMGSVIPGIQPLTRSDSQMSSSVGRAAEEAGGAVLNIPLQLIYAIGDNNPDTVRRFERALPTIGQHISKALRYSIRGEATTPEGAVIKDFHVPEDRKDLAAVLFQAAGFADTDVNVAQEKHYMKKDVLAYYELRKKLHLQDLAYYHRTGQKEAFQEKMTDVRRYNTQLRRMGLGQLALHPATIRRSIVDRTKKRKYIEIGIPGGKKGVQVSRDVEEGFTEEEVQ